MTDEPKLPKIVEDAVERAIESYFDDPYSHLRNLICRELAKLFIRPTPSKEGDCWLAVIRDGGQGQQGPFDPTGMFDNGDEGKPE